MMTGFTHTGKEKVLRKDIFYADKTQLTILKLADQTCLDLSCYVL